MDVNLYEVYTEREDAEGREKYLKSGAVAKQIVEDLRPWIEHEKAEHIKRAVRMAKRGSERIEWLWDENAPEVRSESLAAATLDKHDAIIRRNLGMDENQGGSGAVNLHVLAGGRAVVQVNQQTDKRENAPKET